MTAALLSLFGTAATMSLLIIVLFALSKAIGGRLKASARRLIWALVMLRLCLPVSGFLPAFITLELPSRAAVSQTSDTTAPPVTETTAALTTQPAAPVTERRIETTAKTETSAAIVNIETASVRQVETSPSTVPPIKSEVTSQAPSTAAETALPAPEPKLSVSEAPETPVEPRHITPEDLARPIAVIWILGGICCFSAMMLSNARATSTFSGSLSEPPAGLLTEYSTLCEKSRIKRRPALRVSKNVKSPLLFRLTRPTIVIPRDLVGSDNLLPMISHELTHYRSGDLWLKLFSAVAVAIWWWNPLVRAASKRLGDEIELACDEKVLDGVSESARISYGDAMLKVVKSFHNDRLPSGLTTQYSPTGKSLKKRLDNILDSSKKRRGYFLIALTLVACVFASGFVSCRAARPPVIVSEDDKIISTGICDGFRYNVYNNYIGISENTNLRVSYSSGIDSKLTFPDIIDGLPVAKLEDGFLRGELSGYSEIELPQLLVWIGDGALSSETAWNGRLTIPDTVSHIGKGALANVSLESDSNGYVIVGGGVLIGYTGTGGELTLPASVRVISGAFTNNKNVSSVKVNSGCTTISDSAFAFSGITEVTLPDSVKSIGRDCFRGSELTNIRMPSGDCSIGRFAFETAGQTLTLTVAENSSAMLWAIENDLPCRIEKTGRNVDPDSIKPVGAGEHEFTDGGEKISLCVNEQLISADKKRAAVVTYDGDLPDTLRIVDLRTLRVTDKLELKKNELIRAIDGYPEEERDYSDCVVWGSFEPSGWSDGVLRINAELVINHESDNWQITAAFSYTPGSGYLATDSIRTNTLLPDYLSGYNLITQTIDESAKLYGKREGDIFGAPLIIRWTYGSISVSENSITPDSHPSLELADMNGDGLNDIVLTWTESGDSTSRMRAEVFFGPTGSKRALIDPCADFSEKAKFGVKDGQRSIVTEFGECALSVPGDTNDLVIGSAAEIDLAGDCVLADLTIKSDGKTADRSVRMVYRYSDGEMKLVNIFTVERRLNMWTANDHHCSELWKIGDNDGEQRFLLVSEGFEGEFTRAATPVEKYSLFDLYPNGLNEQRAVAVVITPEYGENDGGIHRDECYVIVPADGKFREIKVEDDIKDLFTITDSADSWHFASRFGAFDIGKSQFGNEKTGLLTKPALNTRYFFTVRNGSIICNINIDGTGDAKRFANETIRLTYQFDSFYRVKGVDLIGAGTTELSMSFSELTNYLEEAKSTTKRNDQITVNLTNRGNPTLNISFKNGAPFLVSVKAKNQTLTFETPLEIKRDNRLNVYEASGIQVVQTLNYVFGDTYLISDDTIIRNSVEYDPKLDDYLTFYEQKGELRYVRQSMRYNLIDLADAGYYLILDKITSRDDFWRELGKADIVDGGLVLTPEETLTISNYGDLDAGFRSCWDYVANYNSLDEVIARNVRLLTSSNAPTAISLTFEDFKAEVAKLTQSDAQKTLIATITDVDNAVLTVEKRKSGTFLTKVEARGAVREFADTVVFEDSPEITLFAAGDMTALQIVQDKKCDRYLFRNSSCGEEHDTKYDAFRYTFRWFKDGDRIGYRFEAEDDILNILQNMSSPSNIYCQTGHVTLDKSGNVDREPEKTVSISEKYDLDAEFEKHRAELGNYASLDEMLIDRLMTGYGYTDKRVLTFEELKKYASDHSEPNVKFAADIGCAVLLVNSDQNGKVTVDVIYANRISCNYGAPIEVDGSFNIFKADKSVVFSYTPYGKAVYNYIYTPDGKFVDCVSNVRGDDDIVIQLYEYKGKLAYRKVAARYADLSSLPEMIPDADAARGELGYVKIENDKYTLVPNKNMKFSEIFGLDIQAMIPDNSTLDIGGYKAVVSIIPGSDPQALSVSIADADLVLTLEQTDSGSEVTRIVSRGADVTPDSRIILDDSPELSLFTVDDRITVLQVVYKDGTADKYSFVKNGCYRNIESTSPLSENGVRLSERWFKEGNHIGTLLARLSDMSVRKSGYIEINQGKAITHFTREITKPTTLTSFLKANS